MRAFSISGLVAIGRRFVRYVGAINEVGAAPLHAATNSSATKVRLLALAVATAMIVAHPFEANAGGYYYGGYYAPAYYQPDDYYGYGYGYGYRYAAFTWPFFWTVPPDDYCHQRVRIYDNWGGWVWGQRIVC